MPSSTATVGATSFSATVAAYDPAVMPGPIKISGM
jgi:hypothetical protein